MSLYHHFQEAKNAETLPEAEKLGMCLNCKYWDAEGTLTLDQKEHVRRVRLSRTQALRADCERHERVQQMERARER